MTPQYFGECFGWFHDAAGGRGVVLCPAFGVEELVTHRFLRRLASELAVAGMPTLRFDYHGTGDSLGSDCDPGRVDAWLSSIRQAVECLRRETGVREVALVGFRLGALLAAKAAQQLGDISMLAMVGPPISGRSYVREAKALSALLERTARMAQSGGAGAASNVDGVEVAGFSLTMSTVRDLERIDMLAFQSRPAERVIVLGRENVASDSRLVEHLRRLNCSVRHDVLPGYAEMEWNSSLATLPDNAFESLVNWLGQSAPVAGPAHPKQSSTSLATPQWREEPARFGSRNDLFGIYCNPIGTIGTKGGPAVIFVNHGANRHIGWARMYVDMARRFAASGVSSLRMDIAGIGDSVAREGQAENQLYVDESQGDLMAALDWLQAKGYRECVFVGHCAGAYLSFYAALRDVRARGLIMLNVQRFFWRQGDSIEIVSRATYQATDWYLMMLRDPKIWRRLLRGDINITGISRELAQRVLKRFRGGFNRGLGRLYGSEDRGQKVVSWFRELSRRGTKVMLVYTAEDGGLDEIFTHAGPKARQITKLANIGLKILDSSDHNLTPRSARENYFRLVENFLHHEF